MFTDIVIYIILSNIVIVIGILVGQLIRKELQKNKCPRCSCRICCDVGFRIESPLSDEEQETFACMKK